jgi:hypothetical protein
MAWHLRLFSANYAVTTIPVALPKLVALTRPVLRRIFPLISDLPK